MPLLSSPLLSSPLFESKGKVGDGGDGDGHNIIKPTTPCLHRDDTITLRSRPSPFSSIEVAGKIRTRGPSARRRRVCVLCDEDDDK